MRLTLTEVMQCLGCAADDVYWEGSKDVQGNQFVPGEAKDPFLSEAAIRWASAPWAHVCATGAETDNRRIKPGQIFFCLPGERVDGHDFALDAVKGGAIAIVATRNPFQGMSDDERQAACLPPVFFVPDTAKALCQLAKSHRDTTLAKVVGITGTAGKTSVKEVLAQVLATRGHTARNHLNMNNQVGLPLSMLNASPDAAFWVMEVGISQPHDMDELAAILRPDIAVILNAGTGHTQGLGDKGVAYYKSRFLQYIQPEGVGLVCGDYPELVEQAYAFLPLLEHRPVAIELFFAEGMNEKACSIFPCHCSGFYKGPAADRRFGHFSILADGVEHQFDAPFKGGYGAENLAAIFSVARRLGLRVEEIRAGLTMATLPVQRFACTQHGSFTIIDDSYNANPLSSRRMLETVGDMRKEMGVPLLVVMGEMLELGADAPEAHFQLGTQIAQAEPSVVFWRGGCVNDVQAGLKQAGYDRPFYAVADSDEFSELLKHIELDKGIVLFKGSRSNHLELLVESFSKCVFLPGETNAV